MATAERRSPTSGGPLDNAEAAELIAIILANTNTAPPVPVMVPKRNESLADFFDSSVLVGA